jgi:hypothetical protein
VLSEEVEEFLAAIEAIMAGVAFKILLPVKEHWRSRIDAMHLWIIHNDCMARHSTKPADKPRRVLNVREHSDRYHHVESPIAKRRLEKVTLDTHNPGTMKSSWPGKTACIRSEN